jgi:hypothetical protein
MWAVRGANVAAVRPTFVQRPVTEGGMDYHSDRDVVFPADA